MTRRDFLSGMLASVGLSGCSFAKGFGGAPRLSFGVVSDIHVTTPGSTRMFREALRYFRGRGADAVMVAGDLSDWGLRSGLKYVKAAWDEEMAGTGIVPLNCFGGAGRPLFSGVFESKPGKARARRADGQWRI